MVQVSYPGVYVEEFTPGQPIEGVGTSTVAFLGTALQGPVLEPVRLQSWEGFQAVYGDFVTDYPRSYLAPAVYGFFLNGGTDCFVLRASTAAHSWADLLSRSAGSTEPVLVAEARQEGLAGDNISVDFSDSSVLADRLGAAAGPTVKVHLATSALAAPLPSAAGADRRTINVASNAGFQVGELVVIEATGEPGQERVVADVPGTTQVILAAAVTGTATFAGGSLRSADLKAGQRELRIEAPAGFRLDQALPHGATVRIKAAGTADVRTVETTSTRPGGGGIVTLTTGLAHKYVLSSTVPVVASLEFDLLVTSGSATETFTFLSMNAEHPNYWGTAVTSRLVTIREPGQPPASPDPDPRPTVGPNPLSKGKDDDRALAWSNLVNDPNDELAKLDPFGDIDIVCIPGATAVTAQASLVAYCERGRDRFAILDSAPEPSPPGKGVAAQVDGVRGDSLGYAALYYPWILARNPKTGLNEYWPPSGHLAGIYARSDARSGVHAAPANANIRGALGLERLLSDAQQGPLNLAGVNVLRVFPGQSEPMVWGARTTTTRNKYWQYVNIRRLFLFLEKSIEQSLQSAVFQPNDLELWARLERVITDFLTKVWRDGALFGATAKEAFYVRIDEALNPESERALGRLHIEIGVAPSYPAEFIVIRIGIWQGGSAVSEG